MDEEDGRLAGACEIAQAVEDHGHLGSGVFVGAVKLDQSVEEKQGWAVREQGGPQAIEIVGQALAMLDDEVGGSLPTPDFPRGSLWRPSRLPHRHIRP
jgi:hypothetical protein